MFSILVAGNGLAWETEHAMTMDSSRFKEYSETEADFVSMDRPESFTMLEAADTLLMYETGATGPHVGVVRLGKISHIRAGKTEIAFCFKECGPARSSTVRIYSDALVH